MHMVAEYLCILGVHAAHHTERHLRRADHRQLSDLQSKRPTPASAAFSCHGPVFLLTAYVSVMSCTVPRSGLLDPSVQVRGRAAVADEVSADSKHTQAGCPGHLNSEERLKLCPCMCTPVTRGVHVWAERSPALARNLHVPDSSSLEPKWLRKLSFSLSLIHSPSPNCKRTQRADSLNLILCLFCS